MSSGIFDTECCFLYYFGFKICFMFWFNSCYHSVSSSSSYYFIITIIIMTYMISALKKAILNFMFFRCKKYPSMELRGLFQYLVNQLKKGQGIELVLLQVRFHSKI